MKSRAFVGSGTTFSQSLCLEKNGIGEMDELNFDEDDCLVDGGV